MGNYRFRLLDMIPNAWFYKLKDIGNKPKPKPRTQNNTKKPKPQQQQQQQQHFIQHRNSYYFTSNEPFKPSSKERLYNSPANPNFPDVHFPEPPPPQKPSKRRPRRRPTRPNSSKLVTTSSVSAGCSCRASIESSAKTDSTPDSSSSPNTQFYSEPVSSWSSSSSCKLTSSATDIIIDVEKNIYKFDGITGLDPISEIELPPILTKPAQLKNIKKRSPLLDQRSSATTMTVKEENVKKQNQFQCTSKTSPRIYSISPRVKLRANSPKIRANRKPAATNNYTNTTTLKTLRRRKKHVSESFAIVKSSFDPQKDFRDSMVEMIVENNLRAPKDLEELLACYLSLNSNEYHDLIVKVFEQIWFDLIQI